MINCHLKKIKRAVLYLAMLYAILIIFASCQFRLSLQFQSPPSTTSSTISFDNPPIDSDNPEILDNTVIVQTVKDPTTTSTTNAVNNPATTLLPANSTTIAIASESKTADNSISSESEIHNKCKCVNCDEDQICGGLWHAKGFPPVGSEDPHDKKIHIVVSYCKRNLDWISSTFTRGFIIKSIHVISKCGQAVRGSPENATILELPNVGRCDHSYAYYISNLLDKHIVKGEEEDSVVIFLKDDMSSRNLHQQGHGSWSNMERMVREASSTNGFSCGIGSSDKISAYHKVSAWFEFYLGAYLRNNNDALEGGVVSFKSMYKNLGVFHKSVINPDTYPELVQVCYGGVFAASYSNIKKVDHSTWERIGKSLSRGDNIEESHFMERSWGSLLATPLQPFQIEAMKNYTQLYAEFSLESGIGMYQPGLLLSPPSPDGVIKRRKD